ncbi:MAG: DUF421 domain-containing protein [Anaerolineae bacterium]|nr:DUF421 domain-containing protein [Anaerolineae bacterium]
MNPVLRIVVVYVLILVSMRILGKRDFGELSPFDLVTLLLIPEIVSSFLNQQDTSLTNAVVGVTTLLMMVFATSIISQLNKRAENLITGVPTVLVQRGRFLEKNMNKERVTPEEIFAEMHNNGIESLEQVKWAILESDGKIAIIAQD